MKASIVRLAGSLFLPGLIALSASFFLHPADLAFPPAKIRTLAGLSILPPSALAALHLTKSLIRQDRRLAIGLWIAMGGFAFALGRQCVAGFGETESWGNIWQVGVPLALATTLITQRAILRRDIFKPMLLVVLAASLSYSFVGLYNLNIFFDRSLPAVKNMTVVSKRIDQGDTGQKFYAYLRDPSSYRIDLQVSPALYAQVEINDHICTFSYAGRLGAAWQHVSKCS